MAVNFNFQHLIIMRYVVIMYIESNNNNKIALEIILVESLLVDHSGTAIINSKTIPCSYKEYLVNLLNDFLILFVYKFYKIFIYKITSIKA